MDWLDRPWGEGGIAWVDVETTGIDAAKDEIVEVAVVVAPGRGEAPRVALVQRVRTRTPIPPEATAVHGIGDADVADCPSWDEVRPRVLAAIGDRPWGAYNAPFDGAFVGLPLDEAIDCMVLARAVDRYRSGKRLADVVRRRGIVLDAHGAAGDALACAIVWPMLVREAVARSMVRRASTWREWLDGERRIAIDSEIEDATFRARKGLPWSTPWCDHLGVDPGIAVAPPPAPTHRIGQDGRVEVIDG